jgi:hypothetical protein
VTAENNPFLPKWMKGLRSGPYDDVTFLNAPGAGPLVLNSFTGTDITCSVLLPEPPNKEEVLTALGHDPKTYPYPLLREWAELETISISSARSVFPVRRLGENHVHQYTRGGRTIAGTLVFTTFSRDVFAELYRLHGGDKMDSSTPFFVDQIPPFHILLSGINEYGVRINAALINVTLSNWGTTFSIHDLKIESTYTYVAQFFFPMVRDTFAFQNIVKQYAAMYERALSEEALRSKHHDPLTKVDILLAPERTMEERLVYRVLGRLGELPS